VSAPFLPHDRLMAMLTMYCDASGNDQAEAIRVGGFVAAVDDWLASDAEWKIALRDEGIEYFHMREFAHSVEHFKDWKGDESRRRRFLNGLCRIVVTHARFSVGAGVLLETYREVDRDWELHEKFRPCTLCAVTCMDEAVQWRRNQHRDAEPMEFVFESGDEHQGQLLKEGEAFAHTPPIFRTKRQAIPLQAADFIAYEQFKATTSLELNQIFVRFRSSFQRLLKVPYRHGTFEDFGLRVFCRMHDIPQRPKSFQKT
jgi:hypothetical protein